ncbi:MAG: D-aminoacyl-tRNA deacylase [Halieaceae bacterium]|nr:D-aminoacyl-tRNA deacylase [Halieaceae bacterium]
MKALLQRVSQAAVEVEGHRVGAIETGILVLLGFAQGDTEAEAMRMVEKLLGYRMFSDEQGRMNRSVRDIDGGVLLVSQFTLTATTSQGLRPGFSTAMDGDAARELYDRTLEILQSRHARVAAGVFAADMKVSLVNDGPVTFLLEITPRIR